MQSILITNGTIITLGPENKVLFNHDILLENGVIKKIGRIHKSNDSAPHAKIIDAKNKIIMPGFINSHMHFYSTLACGLNKVKPSKNFQEILTNLWWRLDRKLTLDSVYMSALIMMLNAIRYGTTTLIDHHASPFAVTGSLNEIARASKESGLRTCLCYELSDRDGEKIAQLGIKENIEFIRKYQKNPDPFIKALFGLHASFTISDKTLQQAAQAGHDLNTGFHVHTAEALSDQEKTLAMCGKKVVARFHEFGILGPQTIAAHCVHVDDEEIDLLATTNTMVVHNPQSNMNNAVGIADLIKLQNKGILVGLGTDAMTINMLQEARVALWAQHLRANNPAVGFMEVINSLFTNNAKITARIWQDTKLGCIKEGYAADLAIMDYIPATPLNEETVAGHLIFGIPHATVDTTIVGGKILMANKIITLDIDQEQLAAKSRELAAKLWLDF